MQVAIHAGQHALQKAKLILVSDRMEKTARRLLRESNKMQRSRHQTHLEPPESTTACLPDGVKAAVGQLSRFCLILMSFPDFDDGTHLADAACNIEKAKRTRQARRHLNVALQHLADEAGMGAMKWMHLITGLLQACRRFQWPFSCFTQSKSASSGIHVPVQITPDEAPSLMLAGFWLQRRLPEKVLDAQDRQQIALSLLMLCKRAHAANLSPACRVCRVCAAALKRLSRLSRQALLFLDEAAQRDALLSAAFSAPKAALEPLLHAGSCDPALMAIMEKHLPLHKLLPQAMHMRRKNTFSVPSSSSQLAHLMAIADVARLRAGSQQGQNAPAPAVPGAHFHLPAAANTSLEKRTGT